MDYDTAIFYMQHVNISSHVLQLYFKLIDVIAMMS